MSQQRSTGVGLGLALLSAATFGTSGSFARALTEAGWTPGAAVVTRVTIASLVLAVPAVLALRGRWSTLRANLSMIMFYGLLAVGGAQLFFFNALQYLPVGVALLIEYLGIVLVVGWMWLRHGHRPRRLTVVGSVTALAGLALIVDVTSPTAIHLGGVLWALAAAAGLAAFFLVSARADDGLPGVTLASLGMGVGAVALIALGGLGLMPLRATFGEVQFAGHRTSWLVPAAGLSLIAAAIAYVAGIGAARMLGAKLSSFAGLTEVLFGVLFAWLLLGELPTAVQLTGGALIIAGVALVRLDEMRGPAEASVAQSEPRAVEMPVVPAAQPQASTVG